MAAGRSAFAERGLSGTNLRDDILLPAEVSVGSFYHQFKDKTELLLAVLDEHAETFRQRLRDIHTSTPQGTVQEIAKRSYGSLFDLADEDDTLLRIQMKERDSRDPRVRRFLQTNRDRWIESLAEDYRRVGQAHPDYGDSRFDPELAARLVVGLCYAAMAEYMETPPGDRAQIRGRLQSGLVDFTLGGISSVRRHD